MDSWSIQTFVRTVVVDHSFLESEWDAVSGQTGCAIWNAKGETDQCEALVQREAVARDPIAGVTVRVKGAHTVKIEAAAEETASRGQYAPDTGRRVFARLCQQHVRPLGGSPELRAPARFQVSSTVRESWFRLWRDAALSRSPTCSGHATTSNGIFHLRSASIRKITLQVGITKTPLYPLDRPKPSSVLLWRGLLSPSPFALLYDFAQIHDRPYLNRSKSILKAWLLRH